MRSKRDSATVGFHWPDGRHREGPDEGPLDPRLAGHVVAFRDNDAAPDGAVIEGSPDGLKVRLQARVVCFKATGAMEPETIGVEVGVNLGLVLAGDH